MDNSNSFQLTAIELLELCKEVDISVIKQNVTLKEINCLSSINQTDETSLSYVISRETLQSHIKTLKGTVILSSESIKGIDFDEVFFDYIVVNEPKYLFAFTYQKYQAQFERRKIQTRTMTREHINSNISPSAEIDENVKIGEGVEIESGVRIYGGTVIGDNVKIGSNTVLGGIGFGFALRKGYSPLRIPHFGTLYIGNGVEIGSGTHIDRGTFSQTTISDDVKIDNGVHIAHNVFIGRRTLVIAHAEISGSVEIGEDCWIAPNVSIKEKVKIGNNVLVGIGSVVLKDVESNLVVAGIPARQIGSQT
jgi:UDP-3-O-[3-hydroxymyristoyl] glucosamine N-acyltransferase